MILPKPFEGTSEHSLSWAGNGTLAYRIYASYLKDEKQSNISEIDFYSRLLVFPVGGMMIFRVSALESMQRWLRNNLNYLVVPEPLPIQTSLHAIERLFILFSETSNFSWCILDNKKEDIYYFDSQDYSVSTLQNIFDLYTKAINSTLLEKKS